MSYASTDQLAALIDRKHACLGQLRRLGERQMDLVEQGAMGELLEVLAAKQKLIELLRQVELELEPFRGQDPDRRLWRSTAERLRCGALAEQCQALLEEVLRQEQQSESRLSARRDAAAQRLKGAHNAGQARNAYVQQTGPMTGMLDLSSDG